MNDELRRQVIEALRQSQPLPMEWARLLFPPERRECEMVYHGKDREEDILAETMAVPLQPAGTFGSNGNSWTNLLILGDNLQVMKTLLNMKEEGTLVNSDGSKGFRLIYIDPPFATKQEFAGSQDQKAYQDKIVGAQFLEFLRKRLVFMRELLAEDGSIYVHLDTKKVHYVKVLMDEVFGEQRFVNEIIWKRTNARANPNRWPRVHDTLLLYSKGKDFLYNPIKVAADDDKLPHTLITGTDGLKYQTFELTAPGVTKAGESGKPWRGFAPGQFGRHWADSHAQMDAWNEAGLIHWPKPGSAGGFPRRLDDKPFDPATREVAVGDILVDDGWVDDTWMDVDRINQAASERMGYPTQKPEALLGLIVKASSRQGDLVLDAFAGSGTTCVAAERLGRRWVAIDCGKLAIYTVQRRMLSLKTTSTRNGRPLKARPFTLHNAGLYDFSTLRRLPWKDWRFFALRLFGCKDEPHTIGGIQLDGRFRGASVLVFNHLEHRGRRIDEETIQSIHAAVGKKIGRRFFIIAPRGVFDFQQDFLDLEGVRYYALRIPYSIINELHQRQFTSLQQPSTEDEVNAIVDAVGFDFIQPPAVEWRASIEARPATMIKEACLRITKFESRSRLRSARIGLEACSMLLLDFDYNGDVFDFDSVFYAHQLRDADWAAWFPAEELGETLMAVFIDDHGNESRVTIPRSEFREVRSPSKSSRRSK